jgi:hypothetical protein
VPTRSEERVQTERTQPRRFRRSDPARDYAHELMREARQEERYRRGDYGMPWYLWVLAALPWGIPVITLGGCLWVLVAAGISAGGFAIARATRIPIVYRAIWLLAIDGISYTCIVTLLIAVLATSWNAPFTLFPWRPNAGVVPAQGGDQSPVQPEPAPQPKPHKPPPSADRIPGLLAYWDFDAKTEDDRVKDRSGNGNHATVEGAGYTDGVRGQALQCNGRDSSCDLGTAPNLNFAAGAPFTIAGWVRTHSTSGTILSLRNSRDDGADIDITVEGGKFKGLVRENRGIFPTAVLSHMTIHDDTWHHFAVSRSPEGQIELFVDGDSQGKAVGAQSKGAITTDLRALGSERYWVKQGRKGVDGTSAYLDGGIDEVCVFDRVLATQEVRTIAGQ